MVYVVKYKDKYLKFASYASARTVTHPEKASLYSRENEAVKRIKNVHYVSGVEVTAQDLTLWEVNFTFVERQKGL
jgi:hypothetical protein